MPTSISFFFPSFNRIIYYQIDVYLVGLNRICLHSLVAIMVVDTKKEWNLAKLGSGGKIYM